MPPVPPVVAPPPPSSLSIFKEDIFKGKVLFCTGGGSGICREMTEAIVSVVV
jgi:2,4-dienoyl-CoA reductase [(3E)-enoyl-CoA-producing], peroxisomal